MEMKKSENWLNDDCFIAANPFSAVITDITTGLNKWNKTEYQMFFRPENGDAKDIKKTSLRGQNLNNLVDAFGTESSAWIGKSIRLSRFQDIKTQKTVTEIHAA